MNKYFVMFAERNAPVEVLAHDQDEAQKRAIQYLEDEGEMVDEITNIACVTLH